MTVIPTLRSFWLPDWPSTVNDAPFVSNRLPLTNTLPKPVMAPDADADPLPDPLADTAGGPSLPQALNSPANPTAPMS